MIYEYHNQIINKNSTNNFYNKNSFVGYILPNGSIYECKNHNIESIESYFFNSLILLKDHFDDRDVFLDGNTNDPLCKIIQNYLKNKGYDELVALDDFIKKNNLVISTILVGLFGCHLVTRLDKHIITSSSNHEKFYNYLLHGYKIESIDKIMYDNKRNMFYFKKTNNLNIELYNNINDIREDIYSTDDLEHFIKR